MSEPIFDITIRTRQKELSLVLDPGETWKKGRGRREGYKKRVGIGPRIKAYGKILNTLTSIFSRLHEAPCVRSGCIECCYRVPIIHSRTEFTYLQKALEINFYAKSLGGLTVPMMFREWSLFCKSAGLNPHSPYEHPAAMWDWAKHKIPCPLYSQSYGKCLIEDTKPISCRFGQNAAPCRANPEPETWDPWEQAIMEVDLRIKVNEIFNRLLNLDMNPNVDGHIWPRIINDWLGDADRVMFPNSSKFQKSPIYVLFKFSR